MEGLKYKVIKTRSQYNKYCKDLDELLELDTSSKVQEEEIELLTLLIEKWDAVHSSFKDLDPIAMLQALMKEHGLGATDLMKILGISKSYLSEILHYKKGLSKEVIRKLGGHFKMAQEAFNRPYALKLGAKAVVRQAARKTAGNGKQKVQHSGKRKTPVKRAGEKQLQPA